MICVLFCIDRLNPQQKTCAEKIIMDQLALKHRILVIDDEEDYRNVITMALQSPYFEIITANNGLDGLAAAKIHHPDLILCDVNMPKMDGHMLLKKLKEETEFAGIPFIFLTGSSGKKDVRQGMQLGADDYLTKPFTTAELISAVETRLTKKKNLQKYYETQFDDIKSNIVHSLPHEFRTPLNGILGFSQLLFEESDLPEEEVKKIGMMIFKAGHRLHRLLENMVLFGQMQLWVHDKSRIEEMRSESASLLEIAQSVVGKKSAEHERTDAVRISLQNAILQISSIFLTKILEEIIDNALKFSETGSIVHLSSEGNESELHIIISDEGRGMSEEQIKRISGFQQFERGYYEQQGAGLGLVIAKTLVELHGGSLFIVSKESIATSVTVSLPMA